ncbi:MAG: PepSY-like domain-containing protein [Chitinophagaceae bacterium]|jgi:hypothetical protein|nr:PepSY-like domain-containing protein [Chitinophagaceae bacterium]
MVKRFFILLIVGLGLFTTAHAQLREIPAEVMSAFESQYPTATNVEFKDNFVKVYVHFNLDDAKMIASYNNKGLWKETEREWSFDQLSEDIKSGFERSKYADENWIQKETALVYLADGTTQYRLKVEKGEIQKKYLYFNKRGRMIRESFTL